MTKRNHQKLAAVFYDTLPAEDSEAFEVWHEIRDQLMEVLHEDNPRFDRQKFIDATEFPPVTP